MDSLLPFLIIAGFILLNALFVAAEFAIVGVPRHAIERRAAQGHRAARAVWRILENPREQDRFIATAQIGITFASLGLGMYGEHVVAGWIAALLEGLGPARWVAGHAVASALAIALLTYFHIVIGEMVPKSLALQHAERTVLRVTWPMLSTRLALYPLVFALNGMATLLLRAVGVRRHIRTAERYYTPEELELVVHESERGGRLAADSGRMLRELLAFTELTAVQVMVPRVRIAGIPLGASGEELRRVIGETRHARFPVYEPDLDHIAGMVHIKDLLHLLLRGAPLGAEILRPLPDVPETATLDGVLAVMRRTRTQMVIVLDEHGGTSGLITTEDIFDEIVGQIEERTDVRPDIYQDAFGNLHVAGTVRLEEVGERLGVELEHEEVESVSGLVLASLGRPPAVGDTVLYGPVRLRVTAVEGHGVKECLVMKVEPHGTRPLAR